MLVFAFIANLTGEEMLTLEEQLAHFDRYAERAYTRTLRDYKLRKQEILTEARNRIIAGYDLYGAQGYSWPYDRLHAAELEEGADMVNYRLMKMKQGWS
jgi:hypothetical protein